MTPTDPYLLRGARVSFHRKHGRTPAIIEHVTERGIWVRTRDEEGWVNPKPTLITWAKAGDITLESAA